MIAMIYFSISFISVMTIQKNNTVAMPDTALIKLSEQLLYNVKTEEPTITLEQGLATIEKKN